MPLLLDEGCAALPFYVTGKLAYPYLREIMENKGLLVAGIIALCLYLWHLVSFTIVPQSNGNFAPYYLVSLINNSHVFYLASYIGSQPFRL